MFDTIEEVHKHTTMAVTKETIVEKAISPDKVTDMYSEVRKEVIKSIMQGAVVQNNTFNGVYAMTEPNFQDGTQQVFVRFTLNGKEYCPDAFIFTLEDKIDTQKCIKRMVDFYTNELVNIIMHAVFRENQKLFVK